MTKLTKDSGKANSESEVHSMVIKKKYILGSWVRIQVKSHSLSVPKQLQIWKQLLRIKLLGVCFTYLPKH